MRETRLLMGLLLLAIIAGTGLFWRTCRAADAADVPDAPPIAGGNAPTPPATAPAAGAPAPDAVGAAAPPTRIEVGGPFAAEQRRCVLDVQVVVAGDAPDAAAPLAGVEVAVQLQDDPVVAATGVTDPRGCVQFEFVGGELAGEVVLARAGLGAESSTVLSSAAPATLTLRVPTRAVVRGRVVDAGGVGVEGADLVLLRWATDVDQPERRWVVGRSGRDGAFEVRLATGGRFGAMRAGMVPSALRLVRPRRGDGPPPTLTFELVLLGVPAALSGSVVAADGRPVAGAAVQFRSTAPPPAGAELRSPPEVVASDANGAFAVRDLPPGPIAWAARAAGHGWTAGRIELTAGVTGTLVVHLPPACGVRGVVVTTAGEPIPGARIVAGTPDTLCTAATATAADGTFALDDLGPGPTPVLARAAGTAPGQAAEAHTVLDLYPQQPAEWRAVLAVADAGNRLIGFVTDTNLRGLAGFHVVVRQGERTARQTTTGPDGAFALAVDDPRGLDVRAYAPGRPWTSFADAIRRDVDASAGDLHLIVGRTDTGRVHGRVVTADFAGAAAQIGAWHQERREYARFTANDDGSFDLEVPVGSVDLTFEHPGHTPIVRRGVRVERDQTVELDAVQLALAGGLYGAVRGPGGVPPTQCELAILPRPEFADDRRIVAEFAGGSYRFAAVAPGERVLQVRAPGCAAATFAVTIEAGVDLLQDVELQPGLRRRIVVVVPPGAGDRVTLAMQPDGAPQRWLEAAAVARPAPGRDGIAEFVTYMAAGTYEVVAGTRTGYLARERVSYQFDDQPAVELRLAPR